MKTFEKKSRQQTKCCQRNLPANLPKKTSRGMYHKWHWLI
jgi:hypothetical protein